MEFDIQQYIRGLFFAFSFKNRKGDRLYGYSTTKNASNLLKDQIKNRS